MSMKIRTFFFVFVLLLSGCARLDYNDIGLHENVVKGGQAEIDQGRVVDVNGLPGIWLAGHHTSHGAVFANLGEAEVGDTVCVYSTCFTVFDIIVVPQSYQVTHELAPLVLQTSWFGSVLLVLAH
jgi:hypothetical protein